MLNIHMRWYAMVWYFGDAMNFFLKRTTSAEMNLHVFMLIVVLLCLKTNENSID